MNRKRVAIIGATGVLGGELVRLLSQHPHVEVTAVCGSSSAGQPLHEARPSLRGAGELMVREFDATEIASLCDVAFLAVPHGTSAAPAAALLERGVQVIDLGSDFRLRDADEARRYYGGEPAPQALRQTAHYSLPELTGAPPQNCQLIANPGCFATALSLALAPLAPHLSSDASVQAFGVTGSSGSGAAATTKVHHSFRRTSFTAYKALRHQHLGEVRQLIARGGSVPDIAFIPHSSALVRGIHISLTYRRAELDGDALSILKAAYQDASFVDVVPEEVPLGAVIGSNRALLGTTCDKDIAVVFCAIDNLLKGGSGQAVQNMNLLCGFPEEAGLPMVGAWP